MRAIDRQISTEYSPEQERPLGSYGVLIATFSALTGTFALWFRKSGRQLPERVAPGDLLLLTLASHKASRLIAKDRVTSAIRAPFARLEGDSLPTEVSEQPRGRGLRRAVGELLICPYCLGMWTSAFFAAGLLVFPRLTRWVASVLAMFFGSELLQIGYRKAAQS
jgi:hypothetical protein